MAKSLESIFAIPEYLDFCVRYRHDCLRYAIEVCGMDPTWQQERLFRAVSEPGCRVACCSGHGTGKSRSYGVICDWHERVYPFSNTILTANNLEQVRSVVWKELDDMQMVVDERFAWMQPYFIKETKRYYANGYKDSWFVLPKTAPDHKPEALAGQHRDDYLVLVDEASAVPDNKMEVLRGALTHEDNRFVMVSQGTRPTGHFADAFGTLRHIYTTMRFNAEESPLVSAKFIREKLLEYSGHHSPEYQIRVLGKHPDNLSGFLIPRSWCEEAQKAKIHHGKEWGWVFTVDVGEGVYRDSSVLTIGKVSGYDESRCVEAIESREFMNVDPKAFGRKIHQVALNYPQPTIAVDADGPGLAAALELEEFGHNVVRIHWGRPPHAEKARKRYQDQRAFASVQARMAIFEHRMKLVEGKKVLGQTSKIPYDIDRRGRYVIMSKQQMRSLGIPSPDIFDTHCFFFLVDYIPVNYGADGKEQDELRKWAKRVIEGE